MVGDLYSRVLVVDDEPLARKVITSYLVAAGYVVRTAVDGLDALEKLRWGTPDLMIADVEMPRMSGTELLHVVRLRFPRLPVIAMTATVFTEDMEKSLGADAYYQKRGLGFDALVMMVTSLAKRSVCASAMELFGDEPVQARLDGERHFMISCKECLRSFSVSRSCFIARDEHWTTCVHCGSAARFSTDSANIDPQLAHL